MKRITPEILYQSLLLGSFQMGIGSLELTSPLTIKNNKNDHKALNNARDSMHEYMYSGIFWTLLTSSTMFYMHGKVGFLTCACFNFVFMLWIYFKYSRTYTETIEKSFLPEEEQSILNQ